MTETLNIRMRALLGRKYTFAMVGLIGLFIALSQKWLSEATFQFCFSALVGGFLTAVVFDKRKPATTATADS